MTLFEPDPPDDPGPTPDPAADPARPHPSPPDPSPPTPENPASPSDPGRVDPSSPPAEPGPSPVPGVDPARLSPSLPEDSSPLVPGRVDPSSLPAEPGSSPVPGVDPARLSPSLPEDSPAPSPEVSPSPSAEDRRPAHPSTGLSSPASVGVEGEAWPTIVPRRSVPTVRARLVVAYDGSGFHGFALQPTVPTVAGALRDALAKVLGDKVELTCAGRTDAGVHAWGQVVSFDAPADRFDPVAIQRSLNRICGPKVVVREATVAAPDFDARYSALARTYRYTIVNRPVPDPFLAHLAWHVDTPLDLALLRLGCDPLVGEHDFSAFCRKPKLRDGSEPSMVRRIHSASWDDLGDGILRFEIKANAFCHQMVRSVVGTLAEVGTRRLHAGELLGILAGRDRAAAGSLAPPQGLCLWKVHYPDDGEPTPRQ